MAMTNGLLAAVEESLRDGSEGDTRSPICNCKQTTNNKADRCGSPEKHCKYKLGSKKRQYNDGPEAIHPNLHRTSRIQTDLIARGTFFRGCKWYKSDIVSLRFRVEGNTFEVSAAAMAVISEPMKAKAALIRTVEA
jgi:hypothetical protein